MAFTVVDAQKAQTKAFIGYAPDSLVLSRPSKTPDGVGGFITGTPVELAAQRVRVVGLRSAVTRVLPEGRTVQIAYAVIGMPDLDVQLGDTFPMDNEVVEIVNIIRKPSWRVVAEGTLRG